MVVQVVKLSATFLCDSLLIFNQDPPDEIEEGRHLFCNSWVQCSGSAIEKESSGSMGMGMMFTNRATPLPG